MPFITLSHEPLNPTLYARLRRCFGSVLISHAGEAMVGGYGYDETGTWRYIMRSPGEYYRINCPFCLLEKHPDTRHRLWIHHLWGVGPRDPKNNDKFLWAAVCYNENCLQKSPNYYHKLYDQVYGLLSKSAIQAMPIYEGVEPTTLEKTGNPGECQLLSELSSNHPARQYLLSRSLDPDYLAVQFGVSYCIHAEGRVATATGRIIVPLYMHEAQVGWQGRYIGDVNWKATGVAKYYTSPDVHKRLLLYDFDHACKFPVAIVVEGVTDVWAVCSGAVGLLGKTLSHRQAELLRTCWKAVIIMLDGGEVENTTTLQRQLSQVMPTVCIWLPTGTDPATIDKQYLSELLESKKREVGM